MLTAIVKKKDKKMAKKDNKTEEFEKITDFSEPENKHEDKKKQTSHFGRNLLVFLLLAVGGVAFSLSVQIKRGEEANKQTLIDLQSSYEQKLNAINTKVNDIQKEINIVKNKPFQNDVNGVSEEFVNQRLEQLKQELTQYKMPENNEATRINNETTENIPAKQTQEILLASGALIVRDLAEQGSKFEYEAEVLQILAQGNSQAMKYVDIMQKFAVSGVNGKNQLIKSFNKIFANLNVAKVKSEPERMQEDSISDWKGKTIAWMKKMFVSKKGNKRPAFKEKEDEVFALVNEGNLGTALNVLKTSEKYSHLDSEPLMQWQEQVKEYLEFEHAVTGLIMNSIANLHLKEMEH